MQPYAYQSPPKDTSRTQPLYQTLNELLSASLAPNTQKLYTRVWTLMHQFAAEYQRIPFPLDSESTLIFVSCLHRKKLSPQTIRSYLSAVSYFHKIRSVPDHTSSFIVKKLILGASRLSNSPNLRQPVSLTMLWSIIEHTAAIHSSPYTATMYQSMFTLAFYALCRISELTFDKNTTHTLQVSDVTRLHKPVAYRVTFRTFKHSQNPQSILVLAQHPSRYCPVTLLDKFLTIRPRTSGPLFMLPSGNPVTRNEFNHTLQQCLKGLNITSHIKTHSFRIGGATYAAQLGLSSNTIRTLGRWHSDAFIKYIRWS